MKRAVLFLLGFCFLAGIASAETPGSMREQARGKVRVADQLVADAQKKLSAGQTSENMAAALKLYIRAGEIYEQAGSIMDTLKSGVVPQSEIDGCKNSLRNCLEEIKSLKKSLELD